MKTKRLCGILPMLAFVGCIHVAADGRLERWAGGRAAWSVLIPGVGQIMNGQLGKGALMLGLGAVNGATGGKFQEDADGRPEWVWYGDEERAISWVVGTSLSVWSGIDAYKAAIEQNQAAPVRLGAAPPEVGSPAARIDEATPPVLVLNPFGGGLTATLCCTF